MAMSDNDPVGSLLARAGQALRELAEPEWDRMADSVIAAVRNTPRSGWPIVAVDPQPGSAPGAIMVSDLVLRAELARALRVDDVYAPTAIDVVIDGVDMERISVEVTGRYGHRLPEVAEHVRATTEAIVEDMIGPRSQGHHIDVTVTDVVRGNPVND